MKTFNICLASDDNYSKYTGTTIASILKNAEKDENIIFHIIDGGISEENKMNILNLKNIKKCDIFFYQPDLEKFKKIFSRGKRNVVNSPAAFYRLSIPSLLSHVDKVLYLDSDTIVNKSLSGLFEIDLDNYLALVREEVKCQQSGEKYKKRLKIPLDSIYFNSGVLMINNKLCIKENIEQKCYDYFFENYKYIDYQDQDILNYAFNGRTKSIKYTYNFFALGGYEEINNLDDISIMHYASRTKPWSNYCPNLIFVEEYWKYFMLTDWFNENKDKYLKIMEEQKINNLDFHENREKYIKRNDFINKILWWIPSRKLRDNIRKKLLK